MKQKPLVFPSKVSSDNGLLGLMVFWMRIQGAYCGKYCGASVLSAGMLGEGDLYAMRII